MECDMASVLPRCGSMRIGTSLTEANGEINDPADDR